VEMRDRLVSHRLVLLAGPPETRPRGRIVLVRASVLSGSAGTRL
jgi:hypothetical protein